MTDIMICRIVPEQHHDKCLPCLLIATCDGGAPLAPNFHDREPTYEALVSCVSPRNYQHLAILPLLLRAARCSWAVNRQTGTSGWRLDVDPRRGGSLGACFDLDSAVNRDLRDLRPSHDT
ncbi:unnamed protein product [Cyclocybe aegerita]|uniref:Uncharacterized protein n=1 Tax=Cyclocybe aegerita TaxID=1973307 RepID=A0A8S0WI94_CYCAE|nr:unnamed protein product [Cyclocybe aegerita]